MTKETPNSTFVLKTPKPVLGVTYVNAKASLYNFDGTTFTKRKAFLVRGDQVVIEERKQGYSKIAYTSLVNFKTTEYWIESSYLDPNPMK